MLALFILARRINRRARAWVFEWVVSLFVAWAAAHPAWVSTRTTPRGHFVWLTPPSGPALVSHQWLLDAEDGTATRCVLIWLTSTDGVPLGLIDDGRVRLQWGE
jgi:hypothetical protein